MFTSKCSSSLHGPWPYKGPLIGWRVPATAGDCIVELWKLQSATADDSRPLALVTVDCRRLKYEPGLTHQWGCSPSPHYNDAIMGTMASQITSLTSVYSTAYSGAYQRKHQSSASLAFVWGIHRWPVNSPHKWPVTRKMFPFDDVIMPAASIGAVFG